MSYWDRGIAGELFDALMDDGPEGCIAFAAHGTVYRLVERHPGVVLVKRDADEKVYGSRDGLKWEPVASNTVPKMETKP